MKVWGLWSMLHLGPDGCGPELLGVFADRAAAETVRDSLIGKPVDRAWARYEWCVRWQDDEDSPDLVVLPVDVH
jgi:hypothetical protein